MLLQRKEHVDDGLKFGDGENRNPLLSSTVVRLEKTFPYHKSRE
jgi:hypothetical protein